MHMRLFSLFDAKILGTFCFENLYSHYTRCYVEKLKISYVLMVRESRASDKNMFYVFLLLFFFKCVSHDVPRSQRVVNGIQK